MNGETGAVTALPLDGPSAAAALRAMMTSSYAVFDLVNRIDDATK